jgi:hypothetical protein
MLFTILGEIVFGITILALILGWVCIYPIIQLFGMYVSHIISQKIMWIFNLMFFSLIGYGIYMYIIQIMLTNKGL